MEKSWRVNKEAFKAHVAIDVLKERETLAELALKAFKENIVKNNHLTI